MAENLKAFKDTMRRADYPAKGDFSRSDVKPVRENATVLEESNARYRGVIAAINGMRDRDIERAMRGR